MFLICINQNILKHLLVKRWAQICTNLITEIVFFKNAMGDFSVDSYAADLSTNDCDNVLTGLGELLMRLHLDRMAHQNVKITLKRDERTSSVDYTPESNLV